MSDPRSPSLDAAVEAACDQMRDFGHAGTAASESMMRTVIEAALPYLQSSPEGAGEPHEPNEPYSVCSRCGSHDDVRRTTCLRDECAGQMQAVYPAAVSRPREPSMEDRAAYFAEVEARHDGRDLGSAAGIGPEPNSLDNREAEEEQ